MLFSNSSPKISKSGIQGPTFRLFFSFNFIPFKCFLLIVVKIHTRTNIYIYIYIYIYIVKEKAIIIIIKRKTVPPTFPKKNVQLFSYNSPVQSMYSCYLDKCFQKSKIILTGPLTAPRFIKIMETHFVILHFMSNCVPTISNRYL